MHTSSDRCFFFRTRTFDRKLYDGLPIIRTSIVDFEGHGTSIDGWVFSKDNESTRSLTNTSLFVGHWTSFSLTLSIANLPKCLSHGYPRLPTSHPPDSRI